MKKKTAYIIGFSTVSLLLIFIIVMFGSYWWLSNKWKDYYHEDEMKKMSEEINKAPSLPENFYIAYDKIYPEQRKRNLKQMSLLSVYGLLTKDKKILREKSCNCIQASNYFENNVPASYHSWTSYIIAFGLEKFSNEEKCLDFYYQKLNISEKSFEYFNKNVDNLTIEENLELILRLSNESLYKANPDLLKPQILMIKESQSLTAPWHNSGFWSKFGRLGTLN